MPEPGRVAQPQFKRGEELPYGDASAANALIGLAPISGAVEDDVAFEPSGEEESYIFGPSDRPNEPITAGAPFGPGGNVSRAAISLDADAVRRVADQITANRTSSPEARRFAERVRAGE